MNNVHNPIPKANIPMLVLRVYQLVPVSFWFPVNVYLPLYLHGISGSPDVLLIEPGCLGNLPAVVISCLNLFKYFFFCRHVRISAHTITYVLR